MNYQQLTSSLQAMTENQFPDTYLADGSTFTTAQQLALFVVQAEQRIFNTIQFPSLRKNVTGSTSTGNKYLSCPNDFLASYSMAVIDATGSYEYLLNKDVNFIRQAYPNPTDVAIPRYYALFGPTVTADVPSIITNELSFILGPTPNTVYTVELHYYYYPESITTAGTSWLGDNIDSVLLYGALVEAYTFMKSEADIMGFINTKYNEALGLAKRLGNGMEMTDQYRTGQPRVQVK